MCVRSEYIFVHGCVLECVFSMFVEMSCAHVRVCVCVCHCSACFPAHIFLFNIQLSSSTFFQKNKNKPKADSQRRAVGSSFRERFQGFVLTRTERKQNLKG